MSCAAVIAVLVPTPFPNVATHVVQAQLVGLLCAYGLGAVTWGSARLRRNVAPIPSHFIKPVAACVFIALALVAATSGKLPFGFSWQAEMHTRYLVQFADKSLAIVPSYHLHRTAEVLGIAITWSEIARIGTHHSQPKGLRHFGFADAEVR